MRKEVKKGSISTISNNEVILDDTGKPSIMVRIPKFKLSDVIDGAPEVTHPAFIIDGVEVPEIFISKYQNVIVNDRAYSAPFQQPEVNIDFDEAVKACEKKGPGWHLMSNAEWAAIALWCKKNGTLPRGNNDWGNDYSHKDEKGICFDDCKVLTGSGPASWSHDGTPDGIFDLNGNVWEWVSGLRLVDGEIQVVPDNNVAKHIDQSQESTEWQSIKVGDKSIKYSKTSEGLKITTDDPKGRYSSCSFKDIETDIEVPDILKSLALYPSDNTELTDYFWAWLDGETLPFRGGCWGGAASAGVFFLSLDYPRSGANNYIGFRSAFVNLKSENL